MSSLFFLYWRTDPCRIGLHPRLIDWLVIRLFVPTFREIDGNATSSASSKLIHGGLRYLEHYEFRLVSEALAEREVLL
ncbi:hypothetical protein, partial [Citrobacter amalonaticus]|uniref:hypothetical protein n=1 Tax=Citrobacter amalonaticus TaxID=35703 RepID=UPI0018B0EE25